MAIILKDGKIHVTGLYDCLQQIRIEIWKIRFRGPNPHPWFWLQESRWVRDTILKAREAHREHVRRYHVPAIPFTRENSLRFRDG